MMKTLDEGTIVTLKMVHRNKNEKKHQRSSNSNKDMSTDVALISLWADRSPKEALRWTSPAAEDRRRKGVPAAAEEEVTLVVAEGR